MKDPTIESYNKIAQHYDQTNNSTLFWLKQYKTFISLLKTNPRKNHKVVDLGCGTGRDAAFFLNAGLDYIGIDASKEMIKLARSHVPKAKFQIMNIYDLTFPPNYFDSFWANALLLHVPKESINSILESIKQIIKPKGIGFISMREIQGITDGYRDQIKNKIQVRRYFSFYDRKEFENTLEKNKLKLLEIQNVTEEDGTKWMCFFVQK